MIVAPSVLDVSDSDLEKRVLEFAEAGADWIHVDVIDWSRTLGKRNYDVRALGRAKHEIASRGLPTLFNVHIMVDDAASYIDRYASVADSLTVQSTHRTNEDMHRDLLHLHELGIPAGLALNPDESFDDVSSLLGHLHHVLFMTVYSGAGGQKFMSGVVEKVKDGRRYVEGKPFRLLFGVDGGVNDATIVQVRGLVDYVVAGSYVVKSDSKVAIASLRG